MDKTFTFHVGTPHENHKKYDGLAQWWDCPVYLTISGVNYESGSPIEFFIIDAGDHEHAGAAGLAAMLAATLNAAARDPEWRRLYLTTLLGSP